MKTKKSKPKPNTKEMQYIKMIAQSPMMKTYRNGSISWSLQNGMAVPGEMASALIRKGLVKPVRDGLGLMDESQTYVARKPMVNST